MCCSGVIVNLIVIFYFIKLVEVLHNFSTYPLATVEVPSEVQVPLVGNHSKVGYSVTFEAPLKALCSLLASHRAGLLSNSKHRCQIVSICELSGPHTSNLPPTVDSASR